MIFRSNLVVFLRDRLFFQIYMKISLVFFWCENMSHLHPIPIIAAPRFVPVRFLFLSGRFHQVFNGLHALVQWILSDDEEVRFVLLFKVLKPFSFCLADLFFD